MMLRTMFAVLLVADAAAAPPRFVRGLSVALPGPPGKVVAGEFSGDRHLDVVVAAGDLVLLRNAGDGGLVHRRLLAIPKAAAQTPEGYQDVIAGDVNGDGVQDLVAFADLQVPGRIVGRTPDGMAITLSTGSGARTLLGRRGGRPVPAGLLTLPVNASSPQLADVDDDGRLDLVFSATPDARYASGGGSALFMARGRGDGSFEEERALLDPLGKGDALPGGAEIAAADFDRDGHLDVAVGAVDGIRIHPAIGSADPAPAVVLASCADAQVAVGDLDGQAGPDLAVSCFYDGVVLVLAGDGKLGFRVIQRRRVGLQPLAPVIADVIGDRRADVLVPTLAADEHSGFASVLPNAGRGRFAERYRIAVNQANSVAVADLNGDRRRDVVVSDVGRNLVVTAFNDPRRLPANVARAPRGARVSIRSTRAHVAPAARQARFALHCSRGRGQCQGRLEIRGRSGRRLGARGFELEPGRRRTIGVPIADDRFRQRRVHVAAIATYNTARRPAVLTGPTATERRAACHPRGSRTLSATARVRVYALRGDLGDDPLACLPRVGHPHPLGLGYGTQGPFAIAGDLVAFGAQECGDPAFPCALRVQVLDGATGRDIRGGDADAGAIGQIVLRRDGRAAWIACAGIGEVQNRCRTRGPRSVVTFGPHFTTRRLGRGRIRSGSLRISPSGKRISWVDGSTRRSARLGR